MANLNLNTEFHGKRVIVTGASKGLGAALCEALASRGAKIAMLSRSLDKMNNLKKKLKNSSNHISIKLNLLNNKQIKSAINRARIFLKDIDVVIHVAGGGFGLKEARTLAVKMRQLRDDMRDLISVRTSLDNHSAEGQADNARFNYLVSVCVVYNDSKQPYFSSMEDYLNRSTDPVGLLGAQNLANMMYGLDNDYERNLPENKFLQKYKFIDNDLRYVDKQGRLIDADGRLINEEGRYINDDGKFVDKFGNLIDDEGDYVVESEPFLDDEGNPVILDETPQEDKDQDEEAEASEKPTTPKRKKTASTKS